MEELLGTHNEFQVAQGCTVFQYKPNNIGNFCSCAIASVTASTPYLFVFINPDEGKGADLCWRISFGNTIFRVTLSGREIYPAIILAEKIVACDKPFSSLIWIVGSVGRSFVRPSYRICVYLNTINPNSSPGICETSWS